MTNKMIVGLFLISVMIGVILACKSVPPMPIEPTGTSSCPAACDQMKKLGCPEGEDVPDGPSCIQFCVETQERGHSLNPQCLKTIDTCGEIKTKCGQ